MKSSFEVAACGICRTDLAFYFDGFPTRSPLPLTLGHEVSGTVVEAGWGTEEWLGRQVVVPSLIPCGDCEACRAGRYSICLQQLFLGSDLHGGFGTHLRVPARGLCSVPDLEDENVNPNGLDLTDLAAVPDGIWVATKRRSDANWLRVTSRSSSVSAPWVVSVFRSLVPSVQ